MPDINFSMDSNSTGLGGAVLSSRIHSCGLRKFRVFGIHAPEDSVSVEQRHIGGHTPVCRRVHTVLQSQLMIHGKR
jgi:hypothetical protein